MKTIIISLLMMITCTSIGMGHLESDKELLTSLKSIETVIVEVEEKTECTSHECFAESIESTIYRVLSTKGLDDYTIKLIIAQSKHESGNYTNGLTEYNNIFSRQYNSKDPFMHSSGARAEGHSRFAKYNTIEDAVESQYWYLKRYNYSFNWESPYQFALELKKKRYYEADLKLYTRALSKFMASI